MFLNSLKQLFRRPGKALIFFLLMAASTALLSFAAVSMTETNQRIDAAESQFTTVATVTQNRQPGDQLLTADVLDFEGAEYVTPPETRPYYLARVEDYQGYVNNSHLSAGSIHVVEFTPLEENKGANEPAKMRIEKAYYNKYDHGRNSWIGYLSKEKDLEPGDIAYFIQDYIQQPTTYRLGKTYIANFWFNDASSIEYDIPVYSVDHAPISTQRDPKTGEKIQSDIFSDNRSRRFDEVTEGFWEPGGFGEIWLKWIDQLKLWDRHWLPVIPTNDINLLSTFHSKGTYVDDGRAISDEEFMNGSKVCMVSNKVALGGIKVGDKIKLPLHTALYGYRPSRYFSFEFATGSDFTPLNAQGNVYEPFFEDEYEVVGIYRSLYDGENELYNEAFIVPTKSITASDENNIVYYSPMNDWSTSFRIENGKIAEFNTALHNAVPDASRLEIVYDDNGYEEIMQSLKNARLSAVLLLAVGALAALTVIVLLMYFFVVKERKRTAIERSLGLSKRQCRVSLISGILALALPAVVLGSWASWMMGNVEFEEKQSQAAGMSSGIEPEVGDMSVSAPDESIETAYFSRDYSLWAENENSEADIVLDETALAVQKVLYFAVPGAVFICVALLALVMVNGNLRVEPILLMGGQAE